MMKMEIVFVLSILALADCCTILDHGPMNCSEILRILDYHNTARNEVALKKTKLPMARNMWALKWKDTLARIAQNYANKCTFMHNENRPRNAGENIALLGKIDEEMGDVIQMAQSWYNQLEDYDWHDETPKNQSEHFFTQMIWGDTQYLGCGVSFYKAKDAGSPFPFRTFLVCNYEPPGNVEDAKPFETINGSQPRCSNNMVHQKYTGLCAQDKIQQYGMYVPCRSWSERKSSLLSFPYCIAIYCVIAYYQAIV